MWFHYYEILSNWQLFGSKIVKASLQNGLGAIQYKSFLIVGLYLLRCVHQKSGGWGAKILKWCWPKILVNKNKIT